MKLKKANLSVMDRDTLKSAVDELELDGVDRRSRDGMAAQLSRTRRATPAILIELLNEPQVKEVCELTRVDQTGRRQTLIQRLLNEAESTKSPTPKPPTTKSHNVRQNAMNQSDDAEEDDGEVTHNRLPDPVGSKKSNEHFGR